MTAGNAAGWYAFSARRADDLLREALFERVYTVRRLTAFLASAKERGLHGLAVDLDRGVV